MTDRMDGFRFLELLKGGAANLQANANIVDDLNVFPIPDGDTGANMSMTINGGICAAEKCKSGSIADMSDTIAHGMLLNARGNSGVILSQLFAGVAKGFQDINCADVATLGFAFRSGVRRAYDAVMKPTEGTILTVAREAADYACERIQSGSTMESFFDDYVTEMKASLQRTPELLDVLKEAGVIDSGGAGLVYIMEGMNSILHGENTTGTELKNAETAAVDFTKFNENSQMVFGYCTEFLLQLQSYKIELDKFSLEVFKDRLSELGESIVAFQTGTVVKVHIHSMFPGKILEYSQKFGEFLTVKIENMTLQHNDSSIKNEYKDIAIEDAAKEKNKFATVAVVSGEGIGDVLHSLGADVIIDGGQGNNPSTERFIEAFDEANAETIFVFPNNGNIIMAAKQAAELYEFGNIIIIESHDIGGCYAALSMMSFDSGDADQIAAEMNSAMKGVKTGLVVKAVRDANLSGVNIHLDDYIGFCEKNMLAASTERSETVRLLLEKLDAQDHEVIIIISGEGITDSEKNNLIKSITAQYKNAEVFEIDGGNTGYDYEIIIE